MQERLQLQMEEEDQLLSLHNVHLLLLAQELGLVAQAAAPGEEPQSQCKSLHLLMKGSFLAPMC